MTSPRARGRRPRRRRRRQWRGGVSAMVDGDHAAAAGRGCKFVVENDDAPGNCESRSSRRREATPSEPAGRSTSPTAPPTRLPARPAAASRGWRKRPDQFPASASAYMMASRSTTPLRYPLWRSARGRQGLDATPSPTPSRSRPSARAAKRDSSTIDGCARCTTTRRSCLSVSPTAPTTRRRDARVRERRRGSPAGRMEDPPTRPAQAL